MKKTLEMRTTLRIKMIELEKLPSKNVSNTAVEFSVLLYFFGGGLLKQPICSYRKFPHKKNGPEFRMKNLIRTPSVPHCIV